jgi:hypothetical protein
VLCLEFIVVERGEKEKWCDVEGRVGVLSCSVPVVGRDGSVVLGVMGRLFFRRRFWGRLLIVVSGNSHCYGLDRRGLTVAWLPSLAGEAARPYRATSS